MWPYTLTMQLIIKTFKAPEVLDDKQCRGSCKGDNGGSFPLGDTDFLVKPNLNISFFLNSCVRFFILKWFIKVIVLSHNLPFYNLTSEIYGMIITVEDWLCAR